MNAKPNRTTYIVNLLLNAWNCQPCVEQAFITSDSTIAMLLIDGASKQGRVVASLRDGDYFRIDASRVL